MKEMKNCYILLRHGESQANVQQIISSSPAIATKQHGLTLKGRDQGNNRRF